MDRKEAEKPSFITEARRTQIFEAAVATLDEIGYVNASLAQIARRAGISTALISYHFKDKNDLMNYTLVRLVTDSTSYVLERLKVGRTATEKLHIFIESRLAYQATHQRHNNALVEIVFNARTAEGVPYYRLADGEEDPIIEALVQLLREGQAGGEFRSFDVYVMANVIQSAIGEYPLNPNLASKVDLETYCSELIETFDRVVRAEKK